MKRSNEVSVESGLRGVAGFDAEQEDSKTIAEINKANLLIIIT